MEANSRVGGALLPSAPYRTRSRARHDSGLELGQRTAGSTNLNCDGKGNSVGNGASCFPPALLVRIATINIQARHSAAAWNLQAIVEDAELMKLFVAFVQETKI
jgi:hypothetical protein